MIMFSCKNIPRLIWLRLAVVASIFWGGYAAATGAVKAKVSPDGSTIAVMERDALGVSLRVQPVSGKATEWRSVRIPASTNSFNFSSKGDAFLITYINGNEGVLGKLSMTASAEPLEIYRSTFGIAFPAELSPDRYLAQFITRFSRNNYPIHQWKIVEKGGEIGSVGKEFGVPYGNINIVPGAGFFFVTEQEESKKIHSYVFQNGVLPDVKKLVVQGTQDLACDIKLTKCITTERFADREGFYFRIFRIDGSRKCEIKNFPRWISQIQINQSGSVGVAVVADNPRGVSSLKILSFTGEECQSVVVINKNL